MRRGFLANDGRKSSPSPPGATSATRLVGDERVVGKLASRCGAERLLDHPANGMRRLLQTFGLAGLQQGKRTLGREARAPIEDFADASLEGASKVLIAWILERLSRDRTRTQDQRNSDAEPAARAYHRSLLSRHCAYLRSKTRATIQTASARRSGRGSSSGEDTAGLRVSTRGDRCR